MGADGGDSRTGAVVVGGSRRRAAGAGPLFRDRAVERGPVHVGAVLDVRAGCATPRSPDRSSPATGRGGCRAYQSPFRRPQARAPPDEGVGSATKPATSTPPIRAVAEPETRDRFAGRVSTTSVSKAVESPLLGTVSVYSRTSPGGGGIGGRFARRGDKTHRLGGCGHGRLGHIHVEGGARAAGRSRRARRRLSGCRCTRRCF